MRLLFTATAALLISASTLSAQSNMTNKNGHDILPADGDYCLSMNGAPVIDFALNAINFMNNTGQTAQHPGFITGLPNNITGKYFINDTLAYRGTVSIITSSNTETFYFDDPNDTSSDPAELADKATTSACDVMLSLGREYRRGHNRLQGFYGAEGILVVGSSKSKNKYGMEAADALPWDGSSRVISSSTGLGIGVGARAFIGVEYFFAPKISLGAEFGWGLGIATSGRGKTVSEVNDNGNIVEETSSINTSTSVLGIDVDSGGNSLFGSSAALKMNFHF